MKSPESRLSKVANAPKSISYYTELRILWRNRRISIHDENIKGVYSWTHLLCLNKVLLFHGIRVLHRNTIGSEDIYCTCFSL